MSQQSFFLRYIAIYSFIYASFLSCGVAMLFQKVEIIIGQKHVKMNKIKIKYITVLVLWEAIKNSNNIYLQINQMNNSRKSIILSKKEFNTISSVTPNKKQNHSHSIYTQQKNISFENDGSSTAGGVSYAELQIILQNIHQVKKKAGETIQNLQKKNAKMDQQLRVLRQQSKRYQHLQQTIKTEKQSIELKYQAQISSLKDQILYLSDKNKQQSEKLTQLNKQLKNRDYIQQKHNQNIQFYKFQIKQVQNKYEQITKLLKVNEFSNELKIIKQQYNDIPTMLHTMASLKSSLQHQASNIEELNKNNQDNRKQIAHANKVIQTITNQNKQLLNIISDLNKQKQQLLTGLAESQAEKSQVLKDKDHTLNEIGDQIQNIKKDKEILANQKQQQIANLREQIKSLQDKLIESADRERIAKQQQQFKMMVDQVCDEYADYENVTKRIQYLQKYRAEYYFNIQKIQYLCKILDQ